MVGGEEAEASSLFDGRAAYVALGHLHRPQTIAGETLIRYAGSPLPLSVAERDYRHSISVVDLGRAEPQLHTIEVPRLAAFLSFPREGAAPLEQLEVELAAFDFGAPASRGRMPFVEVSILLDRPQPGVTARVRAVLEGKPVRLTRIRSVYPDAASSDRLGHQGEALDALEPGAVFNALHAERYGTAPDAALIRSFEQLVIGVRDEALP